MRIDLADLTGSTAGGLHLATLGGVWQALVTGFGGIRPAGRALAVDPCLPGAWRTLRVRLRWQDRPVGLRCRHDEVAIDCDAPLLVSVRGAPAVAVAAPGAVVPLPPRAVADGFRERTADRLVAGGPLPPPAADGHGNGHGELHTKEHVRAT
jgi:hypothetical protein